MDSGADCDSRSVEGPATQEVLSASASEAGSVAGSAAALSEVDDEGGVNGEEEEDGDIDMGGEDEDEGEGEPEDPAVDDVVSDEDEDEVETKTEAEAEAESESEADSDSGGGVVLDKCASGSCNDVDDLCEPLPCGHSFCRACLVAAFRVDPCCPRCTTSHTVRRVTEDEAATDEEDHKRREAAYKVLDAYLEAGKTQRVISFRNGQSETFRTRPLGKSGYWHWKDPDDFRCFVCNAPNEDAIVCGADALLGHPKFGGSRVVVEGHCLRMFCPDCLRCMDPERVKRDPNDFKCPHCVRTHGSGIFGDARATTKTTTTARAKTKAKAKTASGGAKAKARVRPAKRKERPTEGTTAKARAKTKLKAKKKQQQQQPKKRANKRPRTS